MVHIRPSCPWIYFGFGESALTCSTERVLPVCVVDSTKSTVHLYLLVQFFNKGDVAPPEKVHGEAGRHI
jgi:hypothetical protein